MFLDPTVPGALRASTFLSIVTPRPIGWISTVDAQGHANLAPYSFFNMVSSTPPLLMVAINAAADRPEKDTLANIRSQREFVYNLATLPLARQMVDSSSPVPAGVDEFEVTGLAKAACHKVRAPRVAATPAAMECVLETIVDIAPQGPEDTHTAIVIGRVVGLHIDDAFIDANGRFDAEKARPLARLSGFQYAEIKDTFEMRPPPEIAARYAQDAAPAQTQG